VDLQCLIIQNFSEKLFMQRANVAEVTMQAPKLCCLVAQPGFPLATLCVCAQHKLTFCLHYMVSNLGNYKCTKVTQTVSLGIIPTPMMLSYLSPSGESFTYWLKLTLLYKRPCLLGVVAHDYDPNSQETEAGGQWIQGQSRLHRDSLSQHIKQTKNLLLNFLTYHLPLLALHVAIQ
jgi:hypothetical protein